MPQAQMLGCVLGRLAEGVVKGPSIHRKDKAELVSAFRCVASASTSPGVRWAGELRKSWGGQQLCWRRCHQLGTCKWQV